MRKPLPELLARRAAELGGDFGQPDGRFDRFDLAEERSHALKLVMAPVLQQACRFRGYLPLLRIGQRAPRVDVATQLVD